MLKKSILTVLSSLIFTATAFADDVKIQPVGASGISVADVAVVSADWANGDEAASQHMMRYFNLDAAKAVLDAAPELINNKRALVSLTIGLLILNEQTELDVRKALNGLSTHTDLLAKPQLSIEEVVNALTSVRL
jgi:uncharacterized protein YfiM (DUF2279 family)